MTETKRGHIIRIELERRGDEYGVVFVIWPEGKKKGYGTPYGEKYFLAFSNPLLNTFLSDIEKPTFDHHHDALGVEVEFTGIGRDVVASVVQGGERIYPESYLVQQAREKRESINKEGDDGVRGRRFYACRTADAMREVIEALPIDEKRKNELHNLNTVVQRMVIAENDGGLSLTRLQSF